VFPEDSASAGTSFVDLAEALHLLGREKDARNAVERALAIFKRLERRDEMRERLEAALIEICRRQGHSFSVENLLRDRIAEGRGAPSEEDLERAIDQDELAMMFFRQGQYDEALSLLMDSKNIFERAGESMQTHLAVCYLYIARVHLHTERFDESVEYGRQAVACAKQAHGDESLEATMSADELAVATAFSARRGNDPAKARESITLSEMAARQFTQMQGLNGKEAARSWENNRRLKKMLEPLLPNAATVRELDVPETVAFPTYSFISHAYADAQALETLLKSLPRYVKPVVFEPIDVPPTDFVSEKLISGVLGADGFIFIDSEVSNASFWCAFERDLAVRKHKHMFRFDPITKSFQRVRLEPQELKLAHCFHPADAADVQRVMRWLVDNRSFAAFHDDEKQGELSFPPFAAMTGSEREMRLFSLRTFRTLYLLFLSDDLLADTTLRNHVIDQLMNHPRGTLACWLHAQPPDLPHDLAQALSVFPREHLFALPQRPTDAAFNVHALDDLSVRLLWIHHNIRSGDWTL
jgi:tetratricopeptide (TPR) repeat protein